MSVPAFESGPERPAAGGFHWLRAILLLPLAWWTVRLSTGITNYTFMDLVSLPFHEAGHYIFMFGGRVLTGLGGTINQLLVPFALCLWFLLKERKPFPAALCFWWFGENFINIAIYMADAREMALDLVGSGEHDWNALLYHFGLLDQSSVTTISGATFATGVVAMLAGLAWCVWFVLPDSQQESLGGALTERWPITGLLLYSE